MRLLAKTVNNHNHNWWCKLSAAGVSSKTKEAKKQKKEGSLRHWICLWGQTVVRVILKSMMHEETHGDPTYLRPVTSEEEMPECCLTLSSPQGLTWLIPWWPNRAAPTDFHWYDCNDTVNKPFIHKERFSVHLRLTSIQAALQSDRKTWFGDIMTLPSSSSSSFNIFKEGF